MKEQIYTNYRLQLPDREVLGTLVVRDNLIADIQPEILSRGHNGQGEYLMPGLIELHTDNFERCVSPRPGIRWPLEAAASYHDRDLVSAGVTTVCDAIAIGDSKPDSPRSTLYRAMIETIVQGQQAGKFACDHRLHLRCELSYEQVHRVAAAYIDHPLLSLLSLMDHTPGQRQFVKLEKYKEYYMGKHGVSQEQMELFIEERQLHQQQYAPKNRQALVQLCRERHITLASHDDATVAHVHEALQDEVAIAEFPTTLAAAQAAHANQLKVLIGAPNIVLGGSHSGNISAMELLQQDLVHIISSDYVPQSLLQSLLVIARQLNKPFYQVMSLATKIPAQAIGLTERGCLAVGKRADFVTFSSRQGIPRLTATVIQGKRVA
ncbi:MAG: phosphonate metabolism protein PhnM [Cyanophyceae cyanobacterium]